MPMQESNDGPDSDPDHTSADEQDRAALRANQPNDYRDLSPQEIVRRLEILGPDAYVRVKDARPDTLDNWSDVVTTRVIVIAGARAHYLMRHPEIVAYEPLIIEAVRDPGEVHVDARYERTNSFFWAIDDRHDIMVSILGLERSNSLQCREERRGDRHRGSREGKEIWRK